MDIERIWFGQDWASRSIRAGLLPASWLYRAGWAGYLAMYRMGLKRAYQPKLPTLVVGNFTVGGSGKTPATLALVRLVKSLGHEVVVSCSGYGSLSAHGSLIIQYGALNEAKIIGDEALVYQHYEPDVPLIVGRARVASAQLAEKHFPDRVLILDDGLQHLPLATHLKIVLEPEPDSNRNTLPAGPYREPRDRKRMDIAIPGDVRLVRKPAGLWCSQSNAFIEPNGIEVQALTAIARPRRFIDALAHYDVTLTQVVSLLDHHPMTAGKLLSSFDPEQPIVVTVKDWVKLKDRDDARQYRFWVAHEEATFEPEASLKKILDETIQMARAKMAGQ